MSCRQSLAFFMQLGGLPKCVAMNFSPDGRFLLICGAEGSSRDDLLETLWPDLSLDSAVSNFHFTLHSLRRALSLDLGRGCGAAARSSRGTR